MAKLIGKIIYNCCHFCADVKNFVPNFVKSFDRNKTEILQAFHSLSIILAGLNRPHISFILTILFYSCIFAQTFFHIITDLAGQTYVWHGCKWDFAGPQIYLQPAKI